MSTDGPSVTISGDELRVHFERFDQPAYQLFLKMKALPEYTVDFSSIDESYTIKAPARFAPMLGVSIPSRQQAWLEPPAFFFDDQLAVLLISLAAKRFACWTDCGWGKTLFQLEWSRQVMARTGGKVLGFTLNEIVNQTIEEARSFYGDSLPIVRLHTREEMKAWASASGSGLAITNYEKMNHKGEHDQVVNELRHLAGVWLDESDRLRTGGGKQKWALIKSCRGIEFKLSCTATPAPNDTAEFASQASFLEKMRSDADIIWTYFHRDPKTHRWTVKKHARKAFFEFMSSWSIYIRDPRRYGWRKDHPDIPTPTVHKHSIKPTDEQLLELQRFSTDKSGQMSLLRTQDTNAIQRGKLSQIAKGFVYVKGEAARKVRLIPSNKPKFVADLIRSEVAAGLQVLVWTVFDAESDLIASELNRFAACNRCNALLPKPGRCPACRCTEFRWTNKEDVAFGSGNPFFDVLTGTTGDEDRVSILDRFRRGAIPVLVSRASMLGYGMNFQCCGSMIFSGWNDSYVSYYQAVRRAYRYGQTKSVRVHIPVVDDLEGDMLENIFAKETRNEADIAEMEANYIAARERMKGAAA